MCVRFCVFPFDLRSRLGAALMLMRCMCVHVGTLDDVVHLCGRFQKTFGLSITASQFENLILLKAPETVAIKEVFDALDANSDGRIDGLEFLAALACVCRAAFEEKARCKDWNARLPHVCLIILTSIHPSSDCSRLRSL